MGYFVRYDFASWELHAFDLAQRLPKYHIFHLKWSKNKTVLAFFDKYCICFDIKQTSWLTQILKRQKNACLYLEKYDTRLYNTCSFCIFIGRELCVIKVHTHRWRQLMAWSNLANLFRGSSHDFCQLYYNIKQIDFIFLCFCAVIDHRWRHSVWRTKSHALDCVSCVLFYSSHAMTSSVIYYSTDARKNEIYLLIKNANTVLLL